MELRLHFREWTWQAPDLIAAAVSGLAAGAVLMVLDLCWPLAFGDGNPWATSHKVAALAMGPEALWSSGFELSVVVVALLIHYSLGIFSGLVIGLCIASLHYEARVGMEIAVGAVFGSIVYAVNFHLLTSMFPWFAELRGWSTFLAHLIFGVSAALIYRRLSSRRMTS